MSQNNQGKDDSHPKTNSSIKSRVGHWVRVGVMFLSGGFIFPHAMTEDIDTAKGKIDNDNKAKKQ